MYQILINNNSICGKTHPDEVVARQTSSPQFVRILKYAQFAI
jgi:hypothetical protein